MRINHNIASLNTYRQLTSNTSATSKSLEKLSSGLRINRAGDDAAGLAISEKMRGQIRGLDQASSNAQDGISLLQTAEGALNETHSILQRMRELAVQSATDTNTASDRSEIQKEVDQLASEITRISNTTEFNTQSLLNGAVTTDGVSSMTFQIGANAGQNLSLSINAMDAKTLGISRDKVTGGTATAATTAGAQIDTATLSGTEFGSGIAEGAVVSFAYTAAAAASPATNPTAVNDTANTGYSFAFGEGAALNGYAISFTSTAGAATSAAVDTTARTIMVTGDFVTGGTKTAAEVQGAITTGLTGKGITQSVTVSGTNTAKVTTTVTEVGASNAADINGGADAVSAKSATLKLTSTKGHTQTVAVNGASTSLEISSGAFQGLKLTMKAGQSLATVAASDAVTLDVSAAIASKAEFSGGTKIADAVTEAGLDVSTQTAAGAAITSIQAAIEKVSGERSKLGALQNRFEHTINNLGTSSENLTAAESRVRDVDMAKEMMSYTKNNILTQAATAMLAQANQQPQGVLQLLQ